MTSRYEQNLTTVIAWTEIIDHYWHLYQGELYDHEDFWQNTLHAMTADDWWAWCDIAPSLEIQYGEHWRRYPKLKEDTLEIQRRLQLGKAITKPMGKQKNFTAFRCAMAMHDFINDCLGKPTKKYSKKPEPEPLTPFERLFE